MSLLFNNNNENIKVYAFVGPSGTGKSYRAQMVASENNINYIPFTPNMPSPDYPSEIETIENSVNVKSTGKNLFNKENIVNLASQYANRK